MFAFDPKTGRISVEGTPLQNGEAFFKLREFSVRLSDLAWSGAKAAFRAKSSNCEFRVSTSGGRLRLSVKNGGRDSVFLEEISVRFHPQDSGSPMAAEDWREFVHSQSFGSGSGAKKVGLPTHWLPNNPESSMVYVLHHDTTKDSLLLAAAPPLQGDFVYFKALHAEPHMEGDFGVLIRSEQRRLLRKGRTGAATPIQAQTGKDPLALLEKLGDDLAKAAPKPLKPMRTGWNSWDYFAGASSSKVCFKNLREAKQRLGGLVECFVIDEGWESQWGAWVANWKFPEGTKGFCRAVKKAGGVPGVWTAPLLVNTYTEVFRKHLDWFARAADGQFATQNLSYGPMAFLDPTHPEAEKFLFGIFQRLRADGFEYFKVDFTQRVLQSDLFHDPTVPRGAIVRRAFETIRRAIGDDAYLLACGAPYESVLGVADAVRVTNDIHSCWSHVLINVLGIAGRWWTHRKLWNVDPDFLIVRCPETSPDEQPNRPRRVKPFDYSDYWMSGREMRLNEVKSYALLIYLSAGDVMLGDDLTQLNDEGFAVLRKVLERPLTRAAKPTDLFGVHGSLPSIWQADEEDFVFLGLFNWDEDAVEYEVNLPSLGVEEAKKVELFWGDEALELEGDRVLVRLAPRSSEGLRVYRK